ncbi:thiol:disulfide interchange protein [Psychromonas sp. psych-6C06]|uniref:thiol:disulfide interchange protein DsbA/DsbL n=1 Tax=Psychromonas sp. psych-6C06 TaxID=2058089 RepID=UPI000C34EF8C|nr:thiol:disulfide interchange protein DsbA/DsbL [Psychromonas sp. psych-6C06]PKF60759.1 thiol:disulfide interchange protein [Psychromonas sp. psych-6C06]
MKKFFAIFVALVLLPLSIQAADFEEGKHYTVVKETATAKPEVLEFFSFYCPHCFKFEPLMAQIEAKVGDNVEVSKNHVNFLGKEMGAQLTTAYAAADLLDVKEKVASLIFDRLHTQKKAINGEKDILAIFEKAGISNPEAKGAMASFPAAGIASQMKRNTETFKIRGVPAIIVNGKYQVINNSVKSTDEFVELVDFLTKKTD